MGKLRGFMEFDKLEEYTHDPKRRVKNYKEFTISPKVKELQNQGARCMDCGVPFCHSGCPLGNLIPDFNDHVYNNDWQKALSVLHSTNNFPEFTGRLCPAPCEESCVLGIVNPPVSIELIEKYIIERGFSEGWVKPKIPKKRTGKKIAIVGSGPAGLAAAQQLNSVGHSVTIYEKENKVGGLLRYGIPDFKLEKTIIDRRLNLLKKEGIKFICNSEIGKNVSVKEINRNFDAILLATGATLKRELTIKGNNLKGVVQAMDFLPHNNKVIDNQHKLLDKYNAKNKNVIVIGGGDTGSDCIGTSNRHGASSVTNFEIMAKPFKDRTDDYPWPFWPVKLKTSSSHHEGGERKWSILTKEFVSDKNGNLKSLKTVEVEWEKTDGQKLNLKEIPKSEKEWPCELALLALGFTGPEKSLPQKFGINLNEKNSIISSDNYQTQNSKVFVAGDCRRGQSLIVWAISEGREAAYHIDTFLMGKSNLSQKNISGDLIDM